MQSIVLVGDRSDHAISRILLHELEKSFCINYIRPDALCTVGKSKREISLYELPVLSEFSLQNCVLILKQKAKFHPYNLQKNLSPAIIGESNLNSAGFLSGKMPNIFTCGLSAKECVTVSSREDDTTVVSVQRSIIVNNKKICDPFEIPCVCPYEIEDYAVMAAVLTLVLIGELNENKARKCGKIYFS